ncbi:hypothetical protein LSAT2_019867 [Lamellibrachia satsuma]|nr:hypothetical protein LSAT2_019867 [Lamellibrachia satsuma]
MFSKSLRRRSFQTTLISAWLAAKQLNQTLTRLAEVGTGSLLRRRHGGMTECVALTDGRDPCLITCSASKAPERQLYCDLSAQVIPRLRNLVQLLHAKLALSAATRLASFQQFHPSMRLSFSTVDRHVVFRRPTFLLPSGVQIPDAKDVNPTGIDHDIDSSSPHSALRLYDVTVLEYARRQMALITTLFLTI